MILNERKEYKEDLLLLDIQNKKAFLHFVAGKGPSPRCGHSMSSIKYDENDKSASIILIGGNNRQLCAMNVIGTFKHKYIFL